MFHPYPELVTQFLDKPSCSIVGPNNNNANVNSNFSPSIQFVIEMGFSFDDAVMAMSAVGDDPELMLQYIYSVNQN